MNAILISESGNLENQDRGVIIRDGNRLVLAVADGAGGRSGGKEAAEMATALVREAAGRLTTAESCARALHSIDTSIAADAIAGETTCVVAVVTRDEIFGASVGDSGAWFVSANGFNDLTQWQARKPFLGCGTARIATFSQAKHSAGTLLLATDGLLKYTSAELISEQCRTNDVELAQKRLLDLVRLRSGGFPDDVTFILCPVGKID